MTARNWGVFACLIGIFAFTMLPTSASPRWVLSWQSAPWRVYRLRKWFKFAIRMVAGVYLVGWVFVCIAVAIQWGPF